MSLLANMPPAIAASVVGCLPGRAIVMVAKTLPARDVELSYTIQQTASGGASQSGGYAQQPRGSKKAQKKGRASRSGTEEKEEGVYEEDEREDERGGAAFGLDGDSESDEEKDVSFSL
jgi:ribosomal protein L12E/L44/L45/RPP1/RPP2